VTTTQKSPDPSAPQPTTTGPSEAPTHPGAQAKIPRSRMGGVWVALVVAAVVLLLLLIFVLQNGQRADVSFIGAHGNLPMGVALLLAAVFGVLLVALPGIARIIQLRMLDRRRGTTPAVGPPRADPGDPEDR
jgi:uncharacterized integral membrane protein